MIPAQGACGGGFLVIFRGRGSKLRRREFSIWCLSGGGGERRAGGGRGVSVLAGLVFAGWADGRAGGAQNPRPAYSAGGRFGGHDRGWDFGSGGAPPVLAAPAPA